MRLDPELLAGADDARTVLACVPTAEERAMLGAFLASGGNAEALSDAERFCLDLMKVHRDGAQPCIQLCPSTPPCGHLSDSTTSGLKVAETC